MVIEPELNGLMKVICVESIDDAVDIDLNAKLKGIRYGRSSRLNSPFNPPKPMFNFRTVRIHRHMHELQACF